MTVIGRSLCRDSSFFSSSVDTSLIRPERALGGMFVHYSIFEMPRVKIIFVNVDVDLDHFRCYLMMRSRVRRWLRFCIFVRVHLDRCRLQVKHALVKTTHQDQVNSDSRPPQDLGQKKLPTWLLAFVLAPPPVLELTSEPAPLLS